MAIRGSPVVKDVYLNEQGNEYLPEDEGSSYLDDQGNDIPAPQIRLPGRTGVGPKGFGDPKALLAAHQANLAAQPQPQKIIDTQGKRRVADIAPSPIDLGMEVLKAPIRAIGGAIEAAPGVAKTLYQAGTRPADPESARQLGSLAHGALEGTVDTARKAIGAYATPKEQAGALGDLAFAAVTPELFGAAKGAVAGRRLVSGAAHRTQGMNQIVSALHPNSRTARSLESAIPEIEEHLTQNPGRRAAVMGKTGSLEGLASVSTDVSKEFLNKNYVPISKMLKEAMVKDGEKMVPFGELETERAALNVDLGKLGYFDKHPLVKKFAQASPEVAKKLERLDTVRGLIDSAIDEMAPTNVGSAAILRKYSDLKQISDVSRIRAERHKLMQMAEAGNAAPLRTYVREAAGSLAMGAMGTAALGPMGAMAGAANPFVIARFARMVKAAMTKPKIDPDILVRRAFRNFERGKATMAQPRPIEAVPIKLPGAKPTMRTVGAEEAGQARAAYEANAPTEEGITDLRNTPPTEGQGQLPFVPQEVGGIPQRTGGFEGPQRGLFDYEVQGDPRREALRRQADALRHPSEAPPQLALPPRTGGDIVPSGAEPIQLPSTAQRPLLAERSVVEPPDTTLPPPATLPRQPRQRTPTNRQEELLQNFGGTIRQAEPIQLPPANPYLGAERRRSVLSPEQAAAEQISRRSERRAGTRPPLTIGEAAMTPGATLEGASDVRFHGSNEAADFLENVVKTGKQILGGPK